MIRHLLILFAGLLHTLVALNLHAQSQQDILTIKSSMEFYTSIPTISGTLSQNIKSLEIRNLKKDTLCHAHITDEGDFSCDILPPGIPRGKSKIFFVITHTDSSKSVHIRNIHFDASRPKTSIILTDSRNRVIKNGGISHTSYVTLSGSTSKKWSTFICSIDDWFFEACKLPIVYHGISKGDHSFMLRSIYRSKEHTKYPTIPIWDRKITISAHTGSQIFVSFPHAKDVLQLTWGGPKTITIPDHIPLEYGDWIHVRASSHRKDIDEQSQWIMVKSDLKDITPAQISFNIGGVRVDNDEKEKTTKRRLFVTVMPSVTPWPGGITNVEPVATLLSSMPLLYEDQGVMGNIELWSAPLDANKENRHDIELYGWHMIQGQWGMMFVPSHLLSQLYQ